MSEQDNQPRTKFRRVFDATQGLQREKGQGLDPSAYDEESQTIRGVAVATGTPVQNWSVDEVIDMESLRLDLFNDSSPVLYSHDHRDHIGVVVKGSASVIDGVLRCNIRFSKNNEKGRMVFRDYVDGIRTRLSVGADIGEIVDDPDAEKRTNRLMNCEPYEVSAVAMGADPNAGVDRGYNSDSPRNPKPETPNGGENGMSETNPAPTERTFDFDYASDAAEENGLGFEVLNRWKKDKLSNTEIAEDVAKTLREKYKAEEEARAEAARKKEAESKDNDEIHRSKGTRKNRDPNTVQEVVKKATMREALIYAMTGDAPDGEYGEYVQEIERSGGTKNGGVPIHIGQMSVLERAFTGANASGGALVEPTVDSFVDPSLRYASLIEKLGVKRRTLISGKENLPIVSGYTAVTYQDDDNLDNIAETQPAISVVSVSPHTASCKVRISRTLIKTSDRVDTLVLAQDEVMRAFEEKETAILFSGVAGSHEPIGLDTRTGVGSLTIGTAGSPTFSEMLGAYSTVITALRDVGRIGSFAYVCTAAVWQHLRSTVQTAGDSTKIIAAGDAFADGYFEGKPVFILDSLPTHGLFAGDFQSAEIITWGDMEVRVDDTTPEGGGIDFRFYKENDIGIRRPNAFIEGTRV